MTIRAGNDVTRATAASGIPSVPAAGPSAGAPATGVTVAVKSFARLFGGATYPIALDTYQRPFVWDGDQVDQLIADVQDHLDSTRRAGSRRDYYMGTVLLHRDDAAQRLYVIDGQQRLTSLCVLHHCVTGALPGNQSLSYRLSSSAANIKRAQERFARVATSLRDEDLFDRICFTVVTVLTEDQAFTFFDTQNNRGVPLKATDLLKAYHLRAVVGPDRLRLQTTCAERWERLQVLRTAVAQEADFAPALFEQFLWRARRWTGQKALARESYTDILKEFQEGAVQADCPDSVPLYPSRGNCLGTALRLEPPGGYGIVAPPRRQCERSADLPFCVRQPISRGLGFFLYADKYADMVGQLLECGHPDPEVRAFNELYRSVVAHISPYLRELFLLASLLYVDQFGTRKLLQFALWLDHVLGAIRLSKRYVFKEAPLIFLRDGHRNLLDVIAGSFRPEEVLDCLRHGEQVDAVYDGESIEPGKGVQGRYKRYVLAYYGRTGSLKGKRGWITHQFIEERLA